MPSNHACRLPFHLSVLGLTALGLGSCSGSVRIGFDNESAGSGGTVGSSATGSGGSTASAGTAPVSTWPSACPGVPFDTAPGNEDAGSEWGTDAAAPCGGIDVTIPPSPLDMYIMMDRTDSMLNEVSPGLTRWDALRQGVEQFLSDSTLATSQPRVGFGYFGLTGNPDDPAECLAQTYAQPVLPIEELTTASPKIQKAMQDLQNDLGGLTPWLPALQGALEYTQSWQTANPSRVTALVFVTDGYPTECTTDVNEIVEVVGEYFAGVTGRFNNVGTPSIRTFIVGVGGNQAENGYNLDLVAQAGGSGAATIVNNDGAIDEFASTLVNVTRAQIQCEYPLIMVQSTGTVDPTLVQVVYEPYQGSVGSEQFPMARSAADCNLTDGGWYFDDPLSPTTIRLCPCACASLGAGTVHVRLGCAPRIIG